MRSIPILLLVFVMMVGCSDRGMSPRAKETFITVGKKMAAGEAKADLAKNEEKAAPQAPNEPAGFVAHMQPDEPAKQGGAKKPKIDQPRKIKYSSEMRLIVEQFSVAEDAIKAAVKEAKGFIAQSDANNSPGTPRLGHWRVRVPVENFESFRDAIKKIGEVERNTVDSEDFTAQYYDLEAHIKNRHVERDTIRDLLKEIGKKELKYYLEVKRELDSITDDINRKEGQLRLWANLTDLTTVNVYVREKQKFIADERPKEKEVPTFGSRAGKAWSDSWEAVVAFGENIAILAILLTPWLPIPLGLAFVLWLAIRLLVGPVKKAEPKAKEPPIVLEVVETPDEAEPKA